MRPLRSSWTPFRQCVSFLAYACVLPVGKRESCSSKTSVDTLLTHHDIRIHRFPIVLDEIKPTPQFTYCHTCRPIMTSVSIVSPSCLTKLNQHHSSLIVIHIVSVVLYTRPSTRRIHDRESVILFTASYPRLHSSSCLSSCIHRCGSVPPVTAPILMCCSCSISSISCCTHRLVTLVVAAFSHATLLPVYIFLPDQVPCRCGTA